DAIRDRVVFVILPNVRGGLGSVADSLLNHFQIGANVTLGKLLEVGTLTSGNLILDVEDSLTEILDRIPLVINSPDKLDGIAKVEIHVPHHLNALDPAGVAGVVGRVIHNVSHV